MGVSTVEIDRLTEVLRASREHESRTRQVDDPLWSAREVAAYLGIGVSTWRAYLSRGRAPQADDRDEDRPAGSRIPRWRMSTVVAFKAAQKRGR